jgi:undecaprenyl-diphosphatase
MRVGRQARRTILRAVVSAAGAALVVRAPGARGRAGAAAAAGALAGAAQEWPPALAAAPGAAVAARRDPVAAFVGVAVALASRRVWPVAPRHGADVVPRRQPDPDARPHPDGTGVRIVVNADSGPALEAPPTGALCDGLPGATVVELGEGDDLVQLLHGGDDDEVVAVGAAGGDGTLSAAAGVALARDVPLVAVPSGTLNHLARDLGLASTDDAVAAVRAGTVTRMDVGVFGDRPFVNTASFGGYTEVVDAREQLEDRVGKWPALALALTRVLRRLEPIPVEIDGRRCDVWLVFIGNCRYSPPGFGPSWRERLDDGLLDVRLVDGRRPWARARLVLAVLTGTLARCAPYREWVAEQVEIRSLDGPLRVALDGEVVDADDRVVVAKRPRALTVAVPPT